MSVSIAEPRHLVPGNTGETSGSQVNAALFSSLVDVDTEGKVVMLNAQKIETTDNKSFTITLKPGWTFHDGSKVTADSYIKAWNWTAYAKNGAENTHFFDKVEGYEDVSPADPDGETGPQKAPEPKASELKGLQKVDDNTFKVTLSESFQPFQTMLAYTAFYPMPESAFADIKKYNEAPVGNGPFKMKGTWEHNKQVAVEKFDGYKGPKPKVNEVIFKIHQDDNTAYDEVLADSLDVIKQIPSAKLAVAESDLGARLKRSKSSTFQAFSFPTQLPEYSDVRIRKAISMAIDREAIVKNIFKGNQTAARSWVNGVVQGARPNACGTACDYNKAEAKKLFDEAGGKAKLPKFQLYYNADGGHKEWVDAVCNMVKDALGIEAVGVPEAKFADLLNKLDTNQIKGAFRMGWVMDYPSMENYLTPLYGTGGSSNYTNYSNPEFDALVKKGNSAATIEESIKSWQQAEDILARDMWTVPQRMGQNVFGHSKKVKNVEIDLFFRVDLLKIEVV